MVHVVRPRVRSRGPSRVRHMMTRATNRFTLCLVTALYVAVSRARAERTCSLADETARAAVATALGSRGFDVESGDVWMFNFDALPPSCTDCGNANPASTYGCPRFANERFRERGRGSSSRRRVETSARARPRCDGSETASGRARAVDDVRVAASRGRRRRLVRMRPVSHEILCPHAVSLPTRRLRNARVRQPR